MEGVHRNVGSVLRAGIGASADGCQTSGNIAPRHPPLPECRRCTESPAPSDRAGLTPLEALRAATLDGARALGAQDSLGTVAAGKLADLVVLAADPARDIRNTQTVVAVVKGGVMRERTISWRQGPHASPPPAAGAQPERR